MRWVPILEGRDKQQGTSPAVRGHPDMNSIHPRGVRIQLIQLLNKVSSCSIRVPGGRHLSPASLISPEAPGSLTGNYSQRSWILSLSTFPFSFKLLLGSWCFSNMSSALSAQLPSPCRRGKEMDSGWREFGGWTLNVSDLCCVSSPLSKKTQAPERNKTKPKPGVWWEAAMLDKLPRTPGFQTSSKGLL